MRRALLVPCLALGLASGLEAQSVSARLGGELTGAIGSRVNVPVVVDMRNSGGQRLGSYTARVSWPTSVLSFCTYCTLDSILGTFSPPAVNTDSAYYGVLRFSAASPLGADSEIVLARLPFQVVDDTAATLTLSFSEMSAAGAPFPNLLTMLTAQGGQFCPALGRYGDLDGDGRSNSRDALFVLSHVVGLPSNPAVLDTILGDVDADGVVRSRDALIILSNAVGLAIPGQRVLVFAASSCATGSPRYVRALPDTAELVPGQPLLAVVTATDSAGRPVALTDVSWRSRDPNIAFVEGNGVIVGRAPGSVDIIAEAGPGLQAVVRVNVIARRTNWYVDLQAIGRPVQLGSAARPYAQPADAFRYLSEGDTVRIASGNYLITDDGELWHGAVIIGGTPGDTATRPVLRDYDNDYSVLWLRGGQRTEVHNVVFEDPYQAIDIESVRNLVMRDVRVHWPAGSYGYGVYHCGDVAMDTLRLERTVFEGDSADPAGYAVYISGCVSPLSVGLMDIRDSRFRGIYSAVEAYDVDTLHVERNLFEDLDDYVISLDNEYDVTRSALVFRRNRVLRSRYASVYGYELRSVVVDSSYMESRYDGALYLYGAYSGALRMKARIVHDTIVMRSGASYDEWLDIEDADSVLVSDLLVRGVADTSTSIQGYIDNVNWARIQRTRFLDVGNASNVIYIDDVRRAEIDSVEISACPIAACWGGYGVTVGSSIPGSTFSLRRSSFTNLAYPFRSYYSDGVVLDIHDVVIDSAYVGMQFDNVDSANVTDNVLRRITYQGVYVTDQTGSRGPLVFANDSIACVPGVAYYGMYVSYARLRAAGNVITGCYYYGVYGYYLGSGAQFAGNTLRANGTGIYLSGDTSLARVDSNAISQSGSTGLYVSGPRLLARNNNIRTNGYGIQVQSYYTGLIHRLDGNAFQGNTAFAVSSPYDSTDASGNWWGADGQLPGSGGADAVSGRVNASDPLASEPTVPPLAPPAIRAVAATAAPALAAPQAAMRSSQEPARRPPAATRTATTPELRARAADREARLARQRAEREQRRAAQRASRQPDSN